MPGSLSETMFTNASANVKIFRCVTKCNVVTLKQEN